MQFDTRFTYSIVHVYSVVYSTDIDIYVSESILRVLERLTTSVDDRVTFTGSRRQRDVT